MAANPFNPEELYATLLTSELAALSSTESLGVIGNLIDLSDDLRITKPGCGMLRDRQYSNRASTGLNRSSGSGPKVPFS
jgi:hypothetical protein